MRTNDQTGSICPVNKPSNYPESKLYIANSKSLVEAITLLPGTPRTHLTKSKGPSIV